MTFIDFESDSLIYLYFSTPSAKFSTPEIKFKPVKYSKNVEGVLECNSTGYPKGRLGWFDMDNKEWTDSATMDSKTMEDGLIQVSSRLPLRRGSLFSFTCAVFSATGHRQNESTFNISDLPYSDWIQGKWCKAFSIIFLSWNVLCFGKDCQVTVEKLDNERVHSRVEEQLVEYKFSSLLINPVKLHALLLFLLLHPWGFLCFLVHSFLLWEKDWIIESCSLLFFLFCFVL